MELLDTGIPVEAILFAVLIIIASLMIRSRNLFAAVMLSTIFSLLCTGIYTLMDAVDVAFTEVAVGAGVSTVLYLATLSHTGRREAFPKYDLPTHGDRPWLALVVVVVGGLGSVGGALVAALAVGVLDEFGKWLFPTYALFTLYAPVAVLLALPSRLCVSKALCCAKGSTKHPKTWRWNLCALRPIWITKCSSCAKPTKFQAMPMSAPPMIPSLQSLWNRRKPDFCCPVRPTGNP